MRTKLESPRVTRVSRKERGKTNSSKNASVISDIGTAVT